MPTYGFEIKVFGDSEQQLKKIETAIKSMGSTSKHEVEGMRSDMEQLNETIRGVGETLLAAFAVERIIDFGKEILHVTAEFEGFDNVIKYSSLNTVDATENISFLRDTIKELHLPMREAYEGFQEMQAGLIGTGVEGDRLRSFFKGFESMETVLHQPAYMMSRALYDLKEVGEIGLNKRLEMMLKQSLPGIQKVVKETFGKTMEQLAEEKMPGGEFLVKLGEGMQKHFGAGLENAGHSLISQMNDAQNGLLETMRNMGEKLRPLFVDILKGIKDAFDSAPVQLFIKNLDSIVKLVMVGVETWAIYKGLILANAAAMWVYEGALKAVEIAEYSATFGLAGFTVAAEGLGTAFATLGLAGIAFAIAEIVNQFTSMANALDEVDEKLYHLKQYSSKGEAINSLVREDYMALQQVLSLGKGDDGGMLNEAYAKTLNDIKTTEKQIFSTRSDYMKAVQDKSNLFEKMIAAQMASGDTRERAIDKINHAYVNEGSAKDMSEYLRLSSIIPGLGSQLGGAKEALSNLKAYASDFKALGATGKVTYSPYIKPDEGHKKGALTTVDMTGAKGGLGEAKIVNIKIDTLQKNVGVKESAHQADNAVQLLTRAVNNLASSQSQTQ